MYYEEKTFDGIVYWRNTPYGEWIKKEENN